MNIDTFIEKLNIKEGDTLLITGNILNIVKRIGKENGVYNYRSMINDIINKIILLLGSNGTLMFQTFNWDFCQNKGFNISSTPSQTGSIGNIALKREDFIRTTHPIYSFAVTGKYQDVLQKFTNKGAFDKESPFNFMVEKKVKMIIIDVPLQHSFTFVHHVEEIAEVDYRYNKSFTADYTDIDGNKELKTYDMYVRDIEKNVITDINKLEDIFIDNNVMNKYDIDGITIREIDLYKSYAIIKDDIDNNKAKSLYRIGEK